MAKNNNVPDLAAASSGDYFADYMLSDAVPGDFQPLDGLLDIGSEVFGIHNEAKTIADFEKYLKTRREREESYGLFTKDITMCRFFGSKNGENILAEIEKKNEEQGMGNVAIPNTDIKLINYSVCPQCDKVFSFNDLTQYYGKPKRDPAFQSPSEQIRNDTRVCCPDCGKWFLPALVIADRTPKKEVQFLCRNQTMEAIEKFFMRKGKEVLSKKKENIVASPKNGFKAVKNDVEIRQMEAKPTLIVNLLQYTPTNLAINFIAGSNIEKGDVLFGHWGKPLKW